MGRVEVGCWGCPCAKIRGYLCLLHLGSAFWGWRRGHRGDKPDPEGAASGEGDFLGGKRGKNVNPMPYSRPCLALLAPQPQIPSLPPVGNVWRGFKARGPRGMWLGLDPTGKNPPGGSWACWGNRAPGTKDNETHREGFLVNYPLFYYLLSQPLHPCPSPPVHPKPALV